jgi:hypothetical protein
VSKILNTALDFLFSRIIFLILTIKEIKLLLKNNIFTEKADELTVDGIVEGINAFITKWRIHSF